MKRACTLNALVLSVVLAGAVPTVARAQEIEVGASLLSLSIVSRDGITTIIGVPSGSFGVLNPAMYASFFAGTRVSVEAQVGVIFVFSDEQTAHILNTAGQVNYFLKGNRKSSPYLFASAGFVSVTDAGYTPKTFGAGAGYRFTLGDRLVMRCDGRYTHLTTDVGSGNDMFTFAVSIGGMFGK